MHYILGFFFWFLMRGPLTLGAAAIAILGAGFYLQIGQNERNAERVAAIAAGPPKAFNISQYDADRDMTDQREVVVRAQASMSNRYRLTYSENTGDDYAYMVPLLATTAQSEQIVMGIALYTARDFTFDDLTPELMLDGAVGFGDVGPILEINGRVQSLGKWQDMTDEAFDEKGLTLAANAVIMRPYLDGRAAALAPIGRGIFELFSYVAGALGLLALGKLVLGRKPDAKDDAPAPQVAGFEPMPSAGPTVSPTATAASTVPLWKQRSGLVDDDYVAEPAEFEAAQFDQPAPEPMFQPAQSPVIAPQKPRFGLRKVLIGVVGGLFVLGLVSTVSDLIAKSAPAEVASTETIQDRAAATAADLVVPDADPDRHWTDIDVSPIAEWVVAKFFLAVAGDMDAQITLGMIVGGVFFALFGIRWFFVMRRTLRPRSTARFDSMGLN